MRPLLNDSRLRVRGEGSEQNLRHVLLAKGHQEQRQALIGRVHAATLTRGKRRSQNTENDKFMKESAKT